jgi:ABC-2 family transporter protein
MSSFRRILIMAEMHGRDLTKRHAALALLVALPLSFYLASSGNGEKSIVAGGVGMAFAVSGATLFSVLSSGEVDQRLVLAGYRPHELLLGRLLFLAPMGVAIAGGFSLLMTTVSHPDRPWLTFLGLAAVALASIPFGLAVGAAVPRELEGTLVLIGVVGMQLAMEPSSPVARILPFYGPRQLIAASLGADGAVAWPILVTALYGTALFLAARLLVSRRVGVQRHSPTPSGSLDAGPTEP